ncbi:hypothetical protein N7472_010161 [Penicillium cf. griseofulvum]|uniref:Uncharacterized protein n=1 Tax=Penicillium cf. griseofulvum TaxID=2972120 RepID=A0A9W9M0T0_9EURO|nr:hypothetical protein N7472_010161 [Penicillium cf. griseofulvum]
MRCNDISSENRCSQPVECEDAKTPAGALILNSFVGIHQLHASIYQAIGNVQNDVTNQIGTFASIFSPKPKDDLVMMKNILDSALLFISFGSSAIFNVVLKDMKNVILRGMMADMSGASMASIGSFYKTNIASSITEQGLMTQNTIDSFLGYIMNAWKGMEADYLKSLFSVNNTGTYTLHEIIKGGVMATSMNSLDLSSTIIDVKKTLYGMLIPFAWSVSQVECRPFIWLSTPLPGGDSKTLDGIQWGGITIRDIVESSVRGWAEHNNTNHYPARDHNTILEGFGSEPLGVRDPGFFNFPVCGGSARVMFEFMSHYEDSPSPCSMPKEFSVAEGYNKHGTDVIVYEDNVWGKRILVNGKTASHTMSGKFLNIPDQGTPESTATIYARFDKHNYVAEKVIPACKITATWPRSWPDLIFEDSCIRETRPQNEEQMFKVCCSDEINTDSVPNPYLGAWEE